MGYARRILHKGKKVLRAALTAIRKCCCTPPDCFIVYAFIWDCVEETPGSVYLFALGKAGDISLPDGDLETWVKDGTYAGPNCRYLFARNLGPGECETLAGEDTIPEPLDDVSDCPCSNHCCFCFYPSPGPPDGCSYSTLSRGSITKPTITITHPGDDPFLDAVIAAFNGTDTSAMLPVFMWVDNPNPEGLGGCFVRPDLYENWDGGGSGFDGNFTWVAYSAPFTISGYTQRVRFFMNKRCLRDDDGNDVSIWWWIAETDNLVGTQWQYAGLVTGVLPNGANVGTCAGVGGMVADVLPFDGTVGTSAVSVYNNVCP